MVNDSNATKTKSPTADKRKWVEIGPIPINAEDPHDKYVSVGVNGKTIMLERGQEAHLTPAFARAYKHRVEMQKARLRRRRKLAEEEEKRAREAGNG